MYLVSMFVNVYNTWTVSSSVKYEGASTFFWKFTLMKLCSKVFPIFSTYALTLLLRLFIYTYTVELCSSFIWPFWNNHKLIQITMHCRARYVYCIPYFTKKNNDEFIFKTDCHVNILYGSHSICIMWMALVGAGHGSWWWSAMWMSILICRC